MRLKHQPVILNTHTQKKKTSTTHYLIFALAQNGKRATKLNEFFIVGEHLVIRIIRRYFFPESLGEKEKHNNNR